MDPSQATSASASLSSTNSRKRARENETPSQRIKREKAAERQRRKRERDRQTGIQNALNLAAQAQAAQVAAAQQQAQQQQVQVQPPPPEPRIPPQHQQVQVPPESQLSATSSKDGEDLSPEEHSRRERVRAAARERQRKHRALVKQKKLRELGLDMGNEVIGPDPHELGQYSNGSYPHPVAYGQEIPGHPQHHGHPGHPHPTHPHPHGHPAMHEPPFPAGQPLGGQTFASTLLLSFSCAPLLKAHLLRTLNMTNEELASLEPIIAQAWDHWDQQRRMHYAQQAQSQDPNALTDPAHAHAQYQAALRPVNPATPYNYDPSQHPPPPPPPPVHPTHPPSSGQPNDFRARFHRSLVAPSPFRADGNGAVTAAPGSSAAQTAEVMADGGGQQQAQTQVGLDPALGQARDEAVGVAGKLERT